MTQKLAFFDIDGTILTEKKEIPTSAIQAIGELQANDISVILATGRSLQHITFVQESLNLSSTICFNGAYACFEGKVLANNVYSEEQLKTITEYSKARNNTLVYLTQEECYINVVVDDSVKQSFEFLNVDLPVYNHEI